MSGSKHQVKNYKDFGGMDLIQSVHIESMCSKARLGITPFFFFLLTM